MSSSGSAFNSMNAQGLDRVFDVQSGGKWVLLERKHLRGSDLELGGELCGGEEDPSELYSQIARQNTHVDLEELCQLTNHLTAKRLLSCQDLGDRGLGDSCFLTQLSLCDILSFQ